MSTELKPGRSFGIGGRLENLAVWNSQCLVLEREVCQRWSLAEAFDSSRWWVGGLSVGPSVNCWHRLALLVLEKPVAKRGATSGLIIAPQLSEGQAGPEIKPVPGQDHGWQLQPRMRNLSKHGPGSSTRTRDCFDRWLRTMMEPESFSDRTRVAHVVDHRDVASQVKQEQRANLQVD